MRRTLGRIGRLGMGAAIAALLVSCAAGQTVPATDVTDVGATLQANVGSTVVGDVHYWFEYGPTTDYGSTTPTATLHLSNANSPRRVATVVTGLDEATTYHYRVCAFDAGGGAGLCGHDLTLTTTAGRDSVTGTGTTFTLPELGFAIGAAISASSEADGSSPTGRATRVPGAFYFRLPDTGPIGCLRVEGNRAAIGFMGAPPGFEDVAPPVPILLFVEDNGPTGDRYGVGTIAAPATDCPVPTAADFAPINVGGFPVGPVLEQGDFVVHDHVG